jgi:D-arabinose 1-dehydrogenase-like Zn-dependent alcohol dehydrogenase
MTVYKALKQSKCSIGQWVAISGAGGGWVIWVNSIDSSIPVI